MIRHRWQFTLIALTVWPVLSLALHTYGFHIELLGIYIGIQWVHSAYETPYVYLQLGWIFAWYKYRVLIQPKHGYIQVRQGIGNPPIYSTVWQRGSAQKKEAL